MLPLYGWGNCSRDSGQLKRRPEANRQWWRRSLLLGSLCILDSKKFMIKSRLPLSDHFRGGNCIRVSDFTTELSGIRVMHKKAHLWFAIGMLAATSAAGLAAPASTVAVKQAGLWGVMDLSGHWRLLPEYKSAYYIDSEGVFSITDTSGRQGVADSAGNWLLRPRFSQLDTSGIGTAELIGAQDGDCWGYVNRKGAWIITAKYDSVDKFNKFGTARVRIGPKYGLVDKSGNWVVEPTLHFISSFNKNGFAFAQKIRNEKRGIIDAFGNWTIEPIIDDGYYFQPNGWAAIQIGKKFGYLNEKARVAFLLDLDSLPGTFETEMALASKNGKKGYINLRGDWVVEASLDEARYPRDNLATAKLNGKWGVINAHSEWVIFPRFESIGLFDSGDLETGATLGGQEGFVDRKGRFTSGRLGKTDPDERMPLNSAGWTEAKLNGKWGVLDRSGRWLVPPKYDCINFCWDGPPPAVQVVTNAPRCEVRDRR